MVPRSEISRTGVSKPRRYWLYGAGIMLLAAMAGAGAEIHHAQYQRLQDALLDYQQIAIDGGWPALPAGRTIEPGSEDPRVATLARRLAASGDLGDNRTTFLRYDEVLQAAVLRFQSRHGLEQDALVGRNTLAALNVPVEHRIRQIRLNMERLETLAETERQDFLLVNVPAFEAYLVRDGQIVCTTAVIVGETEQQTPLFEANMTYVVINPTWTVPYSIASEELLPKIQKDPGFLQRGDYSVFDPEGNELDPASIDWQSLHRNRFPFTLVQRAGPANELGRIKFKFPNKYGVSMHDTPGKHLFTYDSRAFSHGCIRVAEPIGFAAMLLDAQGWTREKIDVQLVSGQTHTIFLEDPLPVITVYLTAVTDERGVVHFYRDIYNRDKIDT
jgi:murein L,D-transpeptidase YcbB/YkuD